jgi:hypothetical protein
MEKTEMPSCPILDGRAFALAGGEAWQLPRHRGFLTRAAMSGFAFSAGLNGMPGERSPILSVGYKKQFMA